jgi:hypothetical protein
MVLCDLEISLIGEDLRLLWRESGVATEVQGPATGFGASLLDNAVVRLLKGRLDRRWLADGLEVTILAPAARFAK